MIVRMRVDRGSSVEEKSRWRWRGELEGGVYLVFFWRFIHSQVYDDDGTLCTYEIYGNGEKKEL